ncbi:MAG: GNAT family N-acetyltransferase [Planctomycetota bacterium]|jgi:N-acetylglutamate synthase-like GNAT family acetyltransferase
MSNDLEFRFAAENDVPWLARMNRQLVRDEGHRNKMSLSELEQRMSDFLRNEYEAVIVSSGQNDIGYALYRKDPEWLYLRQIFVIDTMRSKGIGSRIIEWLRVNPWKNCKIIRTDVLVDNMIGINFWKAVGFKDYCITMEMENE